MKKLFFLSLALVPIRAEAAEKPQLPFLGMKLEVRSPLLTESMELPKDSLSERLQILNRMIGAKPKFYSNMPILTPRENIDPEMIKVPDDSVDYKLIVKGVEGTAPKLPARPQE